jgi:hypothetical protein
MKTTSLLLALAVLLATAFVTSAAAARKEVTITGEGMCAKCALHETDKCQTVIQTEENGKTVKYYLEPNKVSKDFHENVCQEKRKVKATGVVKEEHGKKVLVATKLELVK